MSKMKRTYAVVEMAGYEDEKVVRNEFKTRTDADKWMRGFYSGEDEIEMLHVLIRADFADGSTEY